MSNVAFRRINGRIVPIKSIQNREESAYARVEAKVAKGARNGALIGLTFGGGLGASMILSGMNLKKTAAFLGRTHLMSIPKLSLVGSQKLSRLQHLGKTLSSAGKILGKPTKGGVIGTLGLGLFGAAYGSVIGSEVSRFEAVNSELRRLK